jgi:hypothetical protein
MCTNWSGRAWNNLRDALAVGAGRHALLAGGIEDGETVGRAHVEGVGEM